MKAIRATRPQTGISYVEVLLAVAVLALALVPAIEALNGSLTGGATREEILRQQLTLSTRIEDLLAQPYADLEQAADAAGSATVPTSYSDAAGAPDRVVVFLSGYDADNADADNNPFTGIDEGLLWVRVGIEGTVQALTTLRAQ